MAAATVLGATASRLTRLAAVEAALPLAAASLKLRGRRHRAVVAEFGPVRTVLDWARRYRRIDGQPFTLERFGPLEALYADENEHLVVMKAAQRGVSEYAISWACFALDRGADAWTGAAKDGLNVGYIFPTEQHLRDFSKERFSPLKDEHPHLVALFSGRGEFDGVTFKQAGRSYLYVRGANSPTGLKSFPADVLILDEFDEIPPAAVSLARKRLNASTVARELNLSTPMLPGRGIHAEYLLTDQRVWEAGCLTCGSYSELDFFEHVTADGQPHDVWRTWTAERLERAELETICPSCGCGFDHARVGRWVTKQPEARRRGYYVPWYGFPFVKLRQMALSAISHDPTVRTELYRSDLGQPYSAAGSGITEEMIRRLCAPLDPHGGDISASAGPPWRDTTMGIDVGGTFHYRVAATGIDGQRYVLAVGAFQRSDPWAELDTLLERYGVRLAVIDAMPEQNAARMWAERHPGRVLRAEYAGEEGMHGQTIHLPNTETGTAKGIIKINRTAILDLTLARIAAGQEVWPRRYANDQGIIKHYTASIRVEVKDERTGQERPTWVHTGPDHFHHAGAYEVAAQLALMAQPKVLPGVFLSVGASGWNPP